ncbi:TIGR03086 family metal-binding protein [Nocardioides bizhenqiangii]|uniref:TIGR03086 family metal-binding protein n=1 Tax=Nocardioides bizhenqiangii TaxID=3095076 RepID=A0ABZ0ZWY8_9ACTN|nr:TIGR03086 family metal-binding protein [Nocardioides sp. HM61]WQQ28504.1 TIGR03086 family metal-binding protein [Nocardioides sp. HM61]
MIPADPAEGHRTIAGTFTQRVRGVAGDAWDAQSPVQEWQARDVVRHLVEWFPHFLAGGSDIKLEPGPSVDDDPIGAWEQHAAAVQAVLDDPANSTTTFAHPHLPEMPLPQAVSRFYTNDVFMHTWDLARATGQDDRLDVDRCRELYEGMVPMEEVLRQSGQYGARVPVPDDADWQTKLLGFIGRDPEWRPATPG